MVENNNDKLSPISEDEYNKSPKKKFYIADHKAISILSLISIMAVIFSIYSIVVFSRDAILDYGVEQKLEGASEIVNTLIESINQSGAVTIKDSEGNSVRLVIDPESINVQPDPTPEGD